METALYSKLHHDEDENVEAAAPRHERPSRARDRKFYQLICILLLISNLCVVGLWQRSLQEVQRCVGPKLVYSPAKDAIRYEKKTLWRDIDSNVYTGRPRPEHDKAWAKLIEPITIKVSKVDLEAINATSIPLKDGSGFIAETAVYHELHCIKRIRRHLYLDYYYPNMTEDERLREGPHIDHCLEYWREAAMCRGDTVLSTFQWASGKPYSRVNSDHECVDWDRLDAWARSRMVDLSSYDILEPPAE